MIIGSVDKTAETQGERIIVIQCRICYTATGIKQVDIRNPHSLLAHNRITASQFIG